MCDDVYDVHLCVINCCVHVNFLLLEFHYGKYMFRGKIIVFQRNDGLFVFLFC